MKKKNNIEELVPIEETKNTPPVIFDPAKNYQWNVNTEFTFTGKEFEYLFNEMLTFINVPFGVQSTLKIFAVYNMLENKFKEYMATGKIHAITPEEVQALKEPNLNDVAAET
jgi:hypothetical protein